RSGAVTSGASTVDTSAWLGEEGAWAGGLSNSYKSAEVVTPNTTNVGPAGDSDDEMEDGVWDGAPRILRSDALARLFPAPAYASPALEDVFERFMGLVGEKPRQARASDDDEGSPAKHVPSVGNVKDTAESEASSDEGN